MNAVFVTISIDIKSVSRIDSRISSSSKKMKYINKLVGEIIQKFHDFLSPKIQQNVFWTHKSILFLYLRVPTLARFQTFLFGNKYNCISVFGNPVVLIWQLTEFREGRKRTTEDGSLFNTKTWAFIHWLHTLNQFSKYFSHTHWGITKTCILKTYRIDSYKWRLG